ncbi:hypothetical protein [Massilia sp. NP310]|uniref:phage head spike fiber domain-containing protein n=1 Tax=Massilia sp. NP310 TaxID=2861282 RepID=UPI001C62AA94|nr:hypothetical protein [Massilia sp. NP310]QYG01889.1 hypothetical protein KY496_00025 [Massilia sp. NP310]
MIIVDPVVLGDAACTRPSLKWVWDRAGTLVEVPPDTLAVTYDPSDLSKAPYALVEPEARNLLSYSEDFTQAAWGKINVTPVPSSAVAPNGAFAMTLLREAAGSSGSYLTAGATVQEGDLITVSVFARKGTGDRGLALIFTNAVVGTNQIVGFDLSTGAESVISGSPSYTSRKEGDFFRLSMSFVAIAAGGVSIQIRNTRDGLIGYVGDGESGACIWGAMLQVGALGSYIRTAGSPVTRAADVIGPTAGLIYSNVPMVEPPYNAATTYAKDAAVYDPATKIVYWSMQAANVGKPLSDPAWWNKRTAINRWAMFDDRNSTVTSNPEEIIAVVSARAITQGLFAGALDASEVLVSMTHPTRGVVYSEKRNLVLPRSGSSFFGWCFNRLRMRTWFLTLKLPVFANALVTITIRRPGGVAKCGMCMIGPAIDVGLSLMGLSTELKDYSTTTFYPDGSSDTIPRGFSKRMSIDLSVERDRVETIEDDLIKRRQKTLVWLGSTMRGDTMLVGKFSSFRKVIDSYPRSKMALQIEGVLSQ